MYFDYRYNRIEKIKKLLSFTFFVLFIIVAVIVYTGFSSANKKTVSTEQKKKNIEETKTKIKDDIVELEENHKQPISSTQIIEYPNYPSISEETTTKEVETPIEIDSISTTPSVSTTPTPTAPSVSTAPTSTTPSISTAPMPTAPSVSTTPTTTTPSTSTASKKTVNKGWIKKVVNGKTLWYYFDRYGKKVIGWKYLLRNGKKNWYYFNKKGQLLTSTIVDGYTINQRGERVVGKGATFKNFAHLTLYNQDGRYRNNPVCSGGSMTVAGGACGLSTYMAVRYVLTGKDTNFMDFSHEACHTGLFNGVGTSWNILYEARYQNYYIKKYGIKGYQIQNNYASVVQELKKGNVVVFLINNGSRNVESGGFNATPNAHFIALIQYRNKDGKIYVYNPNSSNTGWHTASEIQRFVLNPARLVRSLTTA